MKKVETTNTFVTGVFPDTVADDSTGAATQDGFEFIKAYLDNLTVGPPQAVMDYAAGNSNPDVGTVGVPNGVTEAAGVSQLIEATHKSFGIGPGTYRQWGKFDNPSVTGDRVLLLSGQGVLVATYPDLNDAVWVGGNTANQQAVKDAGGYFYRADDAAGVTVNAAGAWLILPPGNPSYRKTYDISGELSGLSAGWATVWAFGTPFQTNDGQWWLDFKISATMTSAATVAATIDGITTIAGASQSLNHNQIQDNTTLMIFARAAAGGGALSARWNSAVSNVNLDGLILLTGEPTWADDHTFPQGIVY